jgi:Domain of unknown function (DUF4336)
VDRVSDLREWSDGVWIAEAPLRFYGIPFGTRMTVLRLDDGSLLLHSPIHLSPGLQSEINLLGPVKHIVSPNKLHHMFLGAAMATYPAARLHVPPGLVEKRPEFSYGTPLTDEVPEFWAGVSEQLVVRGSSFMQEVVFFHHRSRTLIVADLCENFGRYSPLLTRIVAWIFRMYGRPRMPPDWQLSFRDHVARRTSFSRLLAWDFDRVILAHGALLYSGARPIFQREYAWALT